MQTISAPFDFKVFCSPVPQPKAMLLLHHGYAEHSGRYGHVVKAINDAGLTVYAFDQRHHGITGPVDGLVQNFAQHVQDSLELRDWMRGQHPELPLYLFGHSMGGLLATRSAQANPRHIAGVILSSPALLIGVDTPQWMKNISKVLSVLAPNLEVVPMNEQPLSRVPEVVTENNTDPLCYHGRVKARTGSEMLKNSELVWFGTRDWLHPTLIIHGTADKHTDINGARRFYAEIPSSDKQFVEFEGGYHELYNDLEAARALQLTRDWLTMRAV